VPPIQLHPENPHYFLFRSRPTVLVGSGEHYGAVLNLDFDYARYLAAVQAAGLNLTRTFAGTYREIHGSFRIVENTLAPASGRFICPWKPVGSAAGMRYDLSQYDAAYFARLKDFLREAGRRGIVVELVLFCAIYSEELWRASPMWAGNNVNGLGNRSRFAVYDTCDNDLLLVQTALARRLAGELAEFGNLYYEVMNEPYITDKLASHETWQRLMVDTLAEAEALSPNRHLIARNVANKTGRVFDPHPAVSIYNFHYSEPSAMLDNYGLGCALANDEDGFKGQSEDPYRKENWRAMLSGAAAVSHLDYSFTAACPDGTAPIRGETPGFGGAGMRRQLRVLKDFVEDLDFLRMRPMPEIMSGLAEGVAAHVLADPGRSYAVYVDGSEAVGLRLDMPAGPYRVEWLNPKTGDMAGAQGIVHQGGVAALIAPAGLGEAALRIVRQAGV
jgi:hypothetical protein